MGARLARDACPYVDFAVWGPFHHRLLKRSRLHGVVFGENGKMTPVELYGPADFGAWECSYQLLMTGLIGFNTVDLGPLEDYRKKISGYNKLYGPSAWALLYQCDVRCRNERMERVRRKLDREIARATALGRVASLEHDKDRPWNSVWQAVCADTDFWRRESEEQALRQMVSPFNPLTGEAPIATSSSSLARAGGKRHPAAGTEAMERPAKTHRVAEGCFTHNRRGSPLCEEYQHGRCNALRGITCPRDSRRTHQCAKCLDPGHGAHSPTECTKSPAEPSVGRTPKGKGKGKGQRKGKHY